MSQSSSGLLPPRDDNPSYPHLSLDVTNDTMTTIGVRVGDLSYRFHANFTHHHPTSLGHMDGQPRLVYPVFPTWTFIELEWAQAGDLAREAASMMGISHRYARALPASHLISRLLHGSFPSEILESEVAYAFFWDAHVEQILDVKKEDNLPCRSYVLIERAEAADLAQHIASGNVTNPALNTTEHSILPLLLNAAVPELLFTETAHAQLDWLHLQNLVLKEGRNALPAFLKVDHN